MGAAFMQQILGIDVGGSGIKGAMVDVDTGTLLTERYRIATPETRTPKAVIKTISHIVDHFNYSNKGTIGIGFPFVVVDGKPKSPFSALAIDGWIDYPLAQTLHEQFNVPVTLINDADAAGLAEMHFGAGKGKNGTCLVITLGTGVGSGLFYNGQLVPNCELGKLYLCKDKKVAEARVSARFREQEALSWEQYAPNLNEYLQHIERLFNPELIIIGGGMSKKFEQYRHFLETDTIVMPAQLLNHAGIIGAAMAAAIA